MPRKLSRFSLVMATLMLVMFGIEGVKAARYAMHGVITTARITEANLDYNSPSRTRIRYTFADAAGVQHQGSAEAHTREYGPQSRGTTMNVQYIPSSPSRSRPYPPATSNHWFFGLCALIFTLTAFGAGAAKTPAATGRSAESAPPPPRPA